MLALILVIAIITVPVILSVTAFNGGVNFAFLLMLKRFKGLHDRILDSNDLETFNKMNEFLKTISVKETKPTFKDWLKFGFLGRDE